MGNKSILFASVFLALFIILISAASAFTLSAPNSLYNLGDEMSISANLGSLQDEFLSVYLVCGSANKNLYNNVPEDVTVNFKRKLVKSIIDDLSGECILSADYGNESAVTDSFKISSLINVNLNVVKSEFKAGEIISFSGTAVKENGQNLGATTRGLIESSFSDLTAADTLKTEDFSMQIKTSETMHAGSYPLIITIYDKDERGNILNTGEIRKDITIIQEPEKIDIVTDKQTLNPSEDLAIISQVYDRAGDEFSADVSVKISDAKGKIIYNNSVKSNSQLVVNLPSDSAPGEAIIIVELDALQAEKKLSVNEYKKLSAEVSNGTALIKNIGNVDYSGEIEIIIGNQSITKEVSIKIGESKSFELSAPDGTYDVMIKSPDETLYSGNVALTGKSINVQEIKEQANIFARYPIVWFFLLVFVFLVIVVAYKNTSKDDSYAYPVSVDKKHRKIIVPRLEKENGIVMLPSRVKKAEQVLVLSGQKQLSSVVLLKVKNKLTKNSEENLAKAFEPAYSSGGALFKSDNNFMLVFSPLVTKTFKNELSAIKAAQFISSYLKEHNRKFTDKIEYGIGVNSGDIINTIDGNILKFSNMGKTITTVKKITQFSDQEVLASEDFYKQAMNDVRFERASPDNAEPKYYRIKRVVDSEQNQKFLQDFLRKNAMPSEGKKLYG